MIFFFFTSKCPLIYSISGLSVNKFRTIPQPPPSKSDFVQESTSTPDPKKFLSQDLWGRPRNEEGATRAVTALRPRGLIAAKEVQSLSLSGRSQKEELKGNMTNLVSRVGLAILGDGANGAGKRGVGTGRLKNKLR